MKQVRSVFFVVLGEGEGNRRTLKIDSYRQKTAAKVSSKATIMQRISNTS